MLFHKIQGAGGTGKALNLTFIGTYPQGTDGSSFTFTGVDIGTPASDRLVIAVVHARGMASADLTGVTSSVGTVSIAVNSRNGVAQAAICYLAVASGTTANFTATYNGIKAGAELAIYTLTGWSSSTPSDTAFNSNSTATNSITLDIPSPSVAIYAYTRVSTTVTGTWSSATETYDSDIGNEGTTTAIGAYLFDAGLSHTETITVTGSQVNILVGAVWG